MAGRPCSLDSNQQSKRARLSAFIVSADSTVGFRRALVDLLLQFATRSKPIGRYPGICRYRAARPSLIGDGSHRFSRPSPSPGFRPAVLRGAAVPEAVPVRISRELRLSDVLFRDILRTRIEPELLNAETREALQNVHNGEASPNMKA